MSLIRSVARKGERNCPRWSPPSAERLSLFLPSPLSLLSPATKKPKRTVSMPGSVRARGKTGEKNPHVAAHYGGVFAPTSVVTALDPGVSVLGRSVKLKPTNATCYLGRTRQCQPPAHG